MTQPKDPETGKRLLVVLDSTSPDRYSDRNAVVQRAAQHLRLVGGSMLLLQVCYDSSLTFGSFASRQEVEDARNRVLQAETEKIVELQGTLARELEYPVDYQVIWNHDRSGAILSAARDWDADLVLKEKGDRRFIFGLFSNTDWELLRQSRAATWFVAPRGRRSPAEGVVAAVDQVGDEPDADEHFRLDDQVFDQAKLLSDLYGAPLYVVHAYQPPRGIYGFQGYAPIYPVGIGAESYVATPQMAEADREARDAVARRHGEAIQTFVDQHGIPLDDLQVVEGPTPEVIGMVAERKRAGLIVMGAGDKGRWERLLGHVSAEPTLAEAPCDVLLVHGEAHQVI